MTSKASFIFFAITSGLFAAFSSVFAKLFSDEKTKLLHSYIQLSFVSEETTLLATRILFFAFTFICNSVMWTMFTKALNSASSSVQVSIVNGAANFSASAILGYLIFNEPLAVRWWIGACFILSGTILLSKSQKEKKE
ncbi:hypothetical protein AB4K20DRAFT_1878984 [Rhizopus microsporus]|uniref:EamA domain-containing protein n=1 Tax=Rhizopus microsporus TaxID=58291 RepID=A0A1X0RLA9_RHIZD|nr:hypothetical protein BCV71DRAFT_207228 [Rhizopus microsporus]